jgi:PAS domain S-box-containing protein
MSGTEFQTAWLSDPQLAAHALSPAPVWLWSADGAHILWGNPTAAAIFDASSPSVLAQLSSDPQHVSAAQIKRLAGTLPQGGAPRLERLRGFGASFGGALTCLCSRIALPDNSAGILVVSTERAGKDHSLPERARRLLADFNQPAAVFTADGELIEASPTARERFGLCRDLAALGAEALAAEASRTGRAEGDIPSGRISMLRLGAGPTVTLLVAFDAQPNGLQIASHAGARASDAAAAIAASVAPSRAEPESRPQKFPFRFVWQMDAATRFTLGIEEFAKLIGPNAAAVLKRPWAETADALKLDSQGQIASALASRDTWSGIVVHWPVDGSSERLLIEMSGLPVFDRNRQFEGFRGFGICRNVGRFAELERDTAPAAQEPAANVLAFRSPPPSAPVEPAPVELAPAPAPTPELSPGEHSAFEELARELNARLKKSIGKNTETPTPDDFDVEAEPFIAPPMPEPPKVDQPKSELPMSARNGDAARDTHEGRPILDRLPIGILVYRLNNLIYANRAFLDWTGYQTLEVLAEAGGLDSLFIETNSAPDRTENKNGKTLSITTVNGKQKPVEGRLFSVSWNNENALVLMINTQVVSEERSKATENSLRRAREENYELRAVLDTATDGVLVLDRAGRVLSANRSAEALFGYDAADFTELAFGDLFAPESRRSVLDYLERLARGTAAGILEPGHDAIGRVKQGGLVPLYLTIGRIEDGDKLCAVLRDVTSWKRTEEEMINARQQAERASTAKSEFLAKISHEIRTPLNAIIGFSEVMMDERFGPVGNDRYRQYLKDIHSSGGHLVSLLNDLLDLSKIEAGKLDLSFVSVNLNDLVQQCVAIMQEQANKERVIIRTSLPVSLPPIVADARSVRQIALNLLSNSIKFTGAGGQVIVSTAINDDNEVVLRVRDTGVGMSEMELQTALEPFRQLATSARWGSSGTGLGLPITKALAEANHARFRITSQVDDGTLVEVAFPATRVLAE